MSKKNHVENPLRIRLRAWIGETHFPITLTLFNKPLRHQNGQRVPGAFTTVNRVMREFIDDCGGTPVVYNLDEIDVVGDVYP